MLKRKIYWTFDMDTVLESVKTKERSLELVRLLDTALKASYSKSFTSDKLKDLPIKLDDSISIQDTLSKAKKDILEASLLDITVGIPLEDSFISKLYTWFSNNGLKNFLLDVHVDPSIHGGFVLSLNGKYLDMSFRKVVQTYVQQNNSL